MGGFNSSCKKCCSKNQDGMRNKLFVTACKAVLKLHIQKNRLVDQ